MKTTVIGSWPKPDYLQLPDWFRLRQDSDCTVHVNEFLAGHSESEEFAKDVERSVRECVSEQETLGIDVITDGEMNRENYIYYFCRRLRGFDFQAPKKVGIRPASSYYACTCNGEVGLSDEVVEDMVSHWRKCQSYTKTPVKVTIPGPMTIAISTINSHYPDLRSQVEALTPCINKLVCGYQAAGCQYIQIDEPVFMRNPTEALLYGIECLNACFQGVEEGKGTQRIVHLCCGYPNYLDQTDYEKADMDGYHRLAPALDQAHVDAVSIEDAHRRNDPKLFSLFKRVQVIVGVIKIASSHVESVEEIRSRVNAILQHIPSNRLILAPDCGLGFLPKHILLSKLENMVEAARAVS